VCESSLNCRRRTGSVQPEVRCRVPHSGTALSAGCGGTRAPGRVPAERSGETDLQSAEGGGDAAKQLPIDQRVGPNVGQGRTPFGLPVPRSAPHRKHVGGLIGGEHTGADASDGASEYACCVDLSARHQRAGSRDCCCDRCVDRTRQLTANGPPMADGAQLVQRRRSHAGNDLTIDQGFCCGAGDENWEPSVVGKTRIGQQMWNPRKPPKTFSSALRRDLRGGMSSMRPDWVSSPLWRSQRGCSPPAQTTTPVRPRPSRPPPHRSNRRPCQVWLTPVRTRAASTAQQPLPSSA
jgi:hypothetical protein